jgi:hypothetical protein
MAYIHQALFSLPLRWGVSRPSSRGIPLVALTIIVLLPMFSSRLPLCLRLRAVGLFVSALLGSTLLPAAARAQNLLQNGSFESSSLSAAGQLAGAGWVNPPPAGDDGQTASVPNWTWSASPETPTDSTFSLNKTGGALLGSAGGAQDGTSYVSFGSGSANSGGSIAQNFTATSGQLYIANVWVGRAGERFQQISATVTIKDNVTNSEIAAQTIQMYDVQIGGWKQVTFSFTATSSNLSFVFTDTTAAGDAPDTDLLLDNVVVQAGSIQSSTILGGYGQKGDFSSNTEFTLDGGATWKPAYLVGGHPWGFIPGTNNWINQANDETTGLYTTTTYRVKFTAPAIMASPSMKFTINADNYGTMNINGHDLGVTQGGAPYGTTYPVVEVGGDYIVPGLNIITIDLRDTGGLVGMNFRIDLSAVAAQPITITPVGVDTTPPVFSPPGNIILQATSASGAVATFSATATDNVDGFVPVIFTPASGSVFPVGVTTVAASATDNSGNKATGSFTVTVLGPTKPTITAPANIIAEATSAAGAAVSFLATATDSVTGSPTITYSKNPGTTFPLGTTTVTITATDAAGNAQTAAFDVTVRDTTRPVLALPSTLTAEATSPTGATVAFSATATDAVSGSLPVTLAPASGSMFALGTTTVSASATDAAHNTATGSFSVVVRDTSPPVISVTTGSDFSENFSGYTPGPGSTNTQFQSGLTVGFSGDLPGWTKTGLHAVHAVDLDGHGNWAVMIWQDNVITSTRTTADNVSGSDYVVHFNAGPAVDQDTSQLTSSTDGLLIQVLRADGTTLQQFTYHPGAWSGAPALVPASFHYTGDGSGPVHVRVGPSAPNSGRFGGTIDDITITPSTPANLTLEATSPSGAVATFAATATDLVSGPVAVTAVPASGSTFRIGTTPVSLTAVDGAGNTANANFNVIVQDTTKPSLTLPANLTAEATSGAGAIVNFAATATDAASAATIAYSQNPGTVFPLGTTTVNVTATDLAGNSQTGSFTVTVLDTTKPTLALPTNLTAEATSAAGAVVSFKPTASDAVGMQLFNSGFEAPAISSNTYSYIVNHSTATFGAWKFTGLGGVCNGLGGGIYGFQPPSMPNGVQCAFVQSTSDALSKIETATTFPVVAGESYTVSFRQASRMGIYGPGYGTLTYAVTLNGNGASAEMFRRTTATDEGWTRYAATFVATASGNYTLSFNTISAPTGDCTIYIDDVALTGSAVPVVTTPASGSTFALGTTTVNAAATDGAGNTQTGNFTVTVVDTTKPTLNVPANITAIATSAAGAVVTFAATATDAVSTPTIAYSQNPGTTFSLGTTTVTVSAMDGSGNVQTGSFNVTVNPAVATITLTTPGYTYDGTAKAATATTAPAGLPVTYTYDNGGPAPIAAGTHTVAAQVALPWIAGSAAGTVVIAKAKPTITVNPYGVTYNAAAHTAAGSATGARGEFLAGLDLTGTTHRNAGSYADSWSFTDSTGNYNNASGQLSDAIAPAPLAVAAAAQSKVFGTSDPALGFSVTSGALAGSDTFSGSLVRAAGENVGTYPITQGTLSAGSNYTLSFSGAALTITKATAAIHLGSLTQTYGGAIEDASVVTDPANLTVLWSYNQLPLAFKPSDGTLAAYAPAVGQTIYVNVTGAAGGAVTGAGFGPYSMNSDVNTAAAMSGLVSVGQSAVVKVIIAADGTSFTFSPSLPVDGFTMGPVKAGTYPVTGTVVDWNYSGSVDGVLTIAPATVLVSADAQSKVYGASDPALTYTVTGLQGTDTAANVVTGALSRNVGESTGSYAITQGTLAANSDYTLSFTANSLAITPATLTVTAEAQSKVYGSSDPALTYSVAGLQAGDTASTVLTGALMRTAGESVTASPYAIGQGSLAANGNYALTFVPSTLSITAAPLVVAAVNQTKVYGSPDPALAFGIASGALVGTDGFSGSLLRAAGENVGTYVIGQGSLTAGANYALSYVGATLAVTPKPATVVANSRTKVYGAADPVLTGTLTGFLAGDSVTAAYSRAAGESVAGGPYLISAALSPSSVLSNYAIAAQTAAFTITPAPLQVTANAQTKVYGSSDPALTFTQSGLKFTDTVASVLTGALTRAAGETVKGSPYAITQGTLGANSNYTLGYTGASLSITPATAAISVKGYAGIYDSKGHGATGTATGVGGANLTALLNLGATFANVPGGTANWSFHDTDGNYNDASGAVAITLTKAPATIVVTPYSVTYDGNAHIATASVNGVAGESLAGLDLSATKHTAAGSFADTWVLTDVTGNYSNATGSIADSIGKAAATIVVTPYSVTYDTKAHTATGTATGVKGEALIGLGLTGTTHTSAGTYSDTWSFTDATGNYAAATGAITDRIGKSPQTITLSPLAQMYDGSPKPVTAVTSPVAGLTVTITYSGSASAPVLPGSYSVVATIVDPNYSGTEIDTLTVGVTALVRHGVSLSGDIDGSLQVLLPEDDTFNGNGGISGDLLVPGLPAVRLNGHPTFGGTQDGIGAASPINYTVTLNGNALLRYLKRRTDALAMPTVAAPALPTGIRSVNLNKSTDPLGDWTTLKDLTLNGNVGAVAVPPGVYGSFICNGGGSFTLGVAGATTPSVYQFQSLALNGNTDLTVVGPVIIVLKGDFNVNGNVGSSAHPGWLDVRLSSGSVTLNGNVALNGTVTAPNGTVTISGNSVLTGGLSADRLVINGKGLLAQPSN